MHHIKEFSRFAKSYGEHNIIQREVAKELMASITDKPASIIDLGCGSGTSYDLIDWDMKSFTAIDLSDKMLEQHPKGKKVSFIHADFDDDTLFEKLQTISCDRLISSSSLQWSQDLAKLFQNIKKLGKPFSLSLFTSNTFKAIHETAGLCSPLRSAEEIKVLAKQYLDADVRVQTYTLAFENMRDLFGYIKKSGVSGSRRQLNYKETKSLMKAYPLDYLEFEVVFITV